MEGYMKQSSEVFSKICFSDALPQQLKLKAWGAYNMLCYMVCWVTNAANVRNKKHLAECFGCNMAELWAILSELERLDLIAWARIEDRYWVLCLNPEYKHQNLGGEDDIRSSFSTAKLMYNTAKATGTLTEMVRFRVDRFIDNETIKRMRQREEEDQNGVR